MGSALIHVPWSTLLGRRNTWTNAQIFADGTLLTLGADSDIVFVLNAGTLSADTALDDVLIGTPVSSAKAANSGLLSNVTAAGDFGFYINRGGNSEEFLFMDGSAGVLYLTPVQGGLTIGLAADAPAADRAGVHIWGASAGSVTAESVSLLTLESNTHLSLSLLVPNNSHGGLVVGSPAAAARGYFLYHSSTDTPADAWDLAGGGSLRLRYSAGAFAFQEATIVSTTAGALTLSPTTSVDMTRPTDGVINAFQYDGIAITNYKVVKVTKAHGSDLFDAGATTDNATIWTQPVNSKLIAVMMRLETQFDGTSWSDLRVTMGLGGDNNGLLTTTGNLTSDAVDTEYEDVGAYYDTFLEGIHGKTNATIAWIAYATSTGGNLSASTAGTMDFYFIYEQP